MAAERQAQAAASTTADAVPTISLDELVSQGIGSQSESEFQRAKDLIGEFLKATMAPGATVAKDSERTINTWIAAIDAKLTDQLNAVMHHEDFKKLEASWRGLHYLVDQSETSTSLKIRVLNASKDDLLKDLERASEFDQSGLFKAIYTSEYDQYGGTPYGALIGDYEFGRSGVDMALLTRISNVAAQAHAPFISAASPQLFGMKSFSEINNARDLAKIFETDEYIKWRSFRESEDSRYVALTLPHVLTRVPYGKGDFCRKVDGFDFEEDVDGTDHSKYLWSNAAYAYGARLTDSFAKSGWFATIRGPQGGGKVEGLPIHVFDTGEGEVAAKCPTEVLIPDRREKELSDLGFIALLNEKKKDGAAFFGAQSCQKAKKYDRDSANANAELSTKINYILCTSRFAHFLKVLARERIGKFMEREDCEQLLNRWIDRYVLPDPSMVGIEEKAKRPLREARIEVKDVKGKPGHYQAIAHLRPHFQLEALSASLRLVAELPQPKG